MDIFIQPTGNVASKKYKLNKDEFNYIKYDRKVQKSTIVCWKGYHLN